MPYLHRYEIRSKPIDYLEICWIESVRLKANFNFTLKKFG